MINNIFLQQDTYQFSFRVVVISSSVQPLLLNTTNVMNFGAHLFCHDISEVVFDSVYRNLDLESGESVLGYSSEEASSSFFVVIRFSVGENYKFLVANLVSSNGFEQIFSVSLLDLSEICFNLWYEVLLSEACIFCHEFFYTVVNTINDIK